MYWFGKKRFKAAFLAPALIIYLVFIIMPIGVALYYSFTKYIGIGEPTFIGLANYVRLFKDRILWVSLKNTVIVLGINVLLLIPLSFLLACLLCKPIKAGALPKAFIYSPAIIAPIMVGLLWLFILDPKIGLINAALRAMGLDGWQQQWIGGVTLTPYSVGVIYLWQNLGYCMTIFYAGLKTIPNDIYEAASVDGATGMQRMFRITIPMMKSTIGIVAVLVITGCFKIFETVFQLTNGSPNHLSEVLVTYMYNTTFVSSEYGYGMSIAMFTFALTMVCSVGYIRANVNREAR